MTKRYFLKNKMVKDSFFWDFFSCSYGTEVKIFVTVYFFSLLSETPNNHLMSVCLFANQLKKSTPSKHPCKRHF